MNPHEKTKGGHMTILFSFGFCKPKLKKGKLFGKHDKYPLIVFNFLLIQMVIPTGDTSSLFRQALSGLMQDDDWFIKNAPSVRKERAKARARVFSKNKGSQDKKMKELKEDYYRVNEELRELKQENYDLKSAIKVFKKVTDGESP
jgi:hypothetical protein